MTVEALDMTADVRFMRRLSMVRRAQEMTASMQFDLARSSLSDDEIEEAIAQFGGTPSDADQRWGMSEVFSELLSREPKRIPTPDIATLQRNLINQGYVDAEVPADGQWSPSWYAAFRRWDRDNFQEQLSGKHWLAAPVSAGIELINNTLPSRVWQGIVGTAKGLVQQAPETAERLGALGGAAAGAAIGSVIPGVGTGVGALVGGGIGFLADLFGGDESEEGQGFVAGLLDPLQPFDEYAEQGPRAFFEDVGFVLSAMSIIQGGKMAVGGFRSGQAAIAQAGGGLQGALARTPVQTPGFMARITARALRPVSSRASEWTIDFARTHGLMARANRPLLRTINGTYTGISAASIGGRYAGGLGQGEGTSTIEQAIAESPEAPGVLDWAGLVVNPTQFFPTRLRDLAKASDSFLGEGSAWPFIHVTQSGRNVGARQAFADWKALFASDAERAWWETRLRLDYGIYRRVGEEMRDLGKLGDTLDDEALAATLRADLVRNLRKEAATSGTSETARDLLRYSLPDATNPANGPHSFAGWLLQLDDRGSGLDRLRNFISAERETMRTTDGIREGAIEAVIPGGFAKRQVDPAAVIRQRAEAERMIAESKRIARAAEDARLSDPALSVRLKQEARTMEAQGKAALENLPKPEKVKASFRTGVNLDMDRIAKRAGFRDAADYGEASDLVRRLRGKRADRLPEDAGIGGDELKALRAKVRKANEIASNEAVVKSGQFHLTPARIDTPTRADFFDMSKEYDRMREAVIQAEKAAERGGAEAYKTLKLAREQLDAFVDDLAFRRFIPRDLADRAKVTAPPKSIAEHLKKRAQGAARDVQVPDDVAARMEALGYKYVATGEDILFTDRDVPRMLEALGAGDYTRRRAFFETLGLGPVKFTDRSLFALRGGHEVSELHQALGEAGVKMTGAEARQRIYEQLKKRNSRAAWGPFVIDPKGKRRLFGVDVRELGPDEILGAFEGVDGFTDDVALKVYGALKRGAAFGGEVRFRDPMGSLRTIGRALRVTGLQGFSDAIRTWRFEGDPTRLGALGASAGATVGALEGDEPADILRGAVGGAAVGLGLSKVAKAGQGTYGWLPDKLVRANTALRYTLSFTFDAGRYSEQNLIAMADANLPFMLRPERYISRRTDLKSLGLKPGFAAGESIGGKDAWDEAVLFFDQLNGVSFYSTAEDIDRRLFQAGILGFRPRNFEAAQSYLLAQRGMPEAEIEATIARISRYGLGRSAAEKSANFVFFPFSFSKKVVTMLGDVVLQAPARALLIHEGMRRYHESGLDERVAGFIEQHAPLLEQLYRLNNLAYGISPGRFFLEGLDDHRSNTGKVMQVLGSLFVPSGAATPLAQAAGGLGDLAVNAFVPVVVTGEEIDGLDDIVDRYIPFVRDLGNWFTNPTSALTEQAKAVTEGAPSFMQLQEFSDARREFKDDVQAIADVLGYSSVDGFLQSNMGVGFKAQYDALNDELAERYPTGWRMSQEFENTTALTERGLVDLAEKRDRSAGEDAILSIAEMEATWKQLAEVMGWTQDQALTFAARQVRREASKHADDRRFADLWRLFFERRYGPVLRVSGESAA